MKAQAKCLGQVHEIYQNCEQRMISPEPSLVALKRRDVVGGGGGGGGSCTIL